ncbi:MAG: dTDP-glucose 4,6-dehydratase [Candidatus Wallbacteria bacterium]|nr:dTDP-glucose 4,6-dehydratase [Candidatus Wallbacteria bacterium]
MSAADTRTEALLVTGGAGFIGSNFIRWALAERPAWRIVNVDKLTYAGNLENLAQIAEDSRYRFVRADIRDRARMRELMGEGVWGIVNFAAESHVDRSIESATEFLETNILGTQVLMEEAREAKVTRFLQVSTDEVYGSLGPDGKFSEATPLAPNSPYSASKAAADLMARAAFHTHGFPALITRCSNNYGPYQFPEKLIPLMITNAMAGEALPVYGDGCQVRDWLHVADHCSALGVVLERGEPGEVYNIGGSNELKNLDIVRVILESLGKPQTLIRHVKDRPGHDRRYAIDSSKLQSRLGWRPSIPFGEGIRATIRWYQENTLWWQRIKSGEYLEYYRRTYGERL